MRDCLLEPRFLQPWQSEVYYSPNLLTYHLLKIPPLCPSSINLLKIKQAPTSQFATIMFGWGEKLNESFTDYQLNLMIWTHGFLHFKNFKKHILQTSTFNLSSGYQIGLYFYPEISISDRNFLKKNFYFK